MSRLSILSSSSSRASSSSSWLSESVNSTIAVSLPYFSLFWNKESRALISSIIIPWSYTIGHLLFFLFPLSFFFFVPQLKDFIFFYSSLGSWTSRTSLVLELCSRIHGILSLFPEISSFAGRVRATLTSGVFWLWTLVLLIMSLISCWVYWCSCLGCKERDSPSVIQERHPVWRNSHILPPMMRIPPSFLQLRVIMDLHSPLYALIGSSSQVIYSKQLFCWSKVFLNQF